MYCCEHTNLNVETIFGVSYKSRVACLEMLPKVIVFDLDLTLWPFRVDKDTSPPFRAHRDGSVLDSKEREFKHFLGIHEILGKLAREGYTLGIASRIENVDGAYQLIDLFKIKKYFSYIVIYPGTKRRHFKDLRMHTGVEFKDMLFFDDDRRNIRDISRLGVQTVQVENGITMDLVENSLLAIKGSASS